MIENIQAIYKNSVLRPLQPLDLPENKIVEIDVRDVKEKPQKTVAEIAGHLFGVIDVDAPKDISTNQTHLEGFGE